MNILWKWAHTLINRGGIAEKIGRIIDVLEHILFANSISAKASIGAGTYFTIEDLVVLCILNA